MKLHRLSRDPISDHDASSQDYWPLDGQACLDFKNFTARDQGSDFRITVDWTDVEALIRLFADASHPDAARLVRSQRIASAIADFVSSSETSLRNL
jgi:hypothetical protein